MSLRRDGRFASNFLAAQGRRNRRFEEGPLILTSNQAFGDGDGDPRSRPGSAVTVNIRGNSYRLKAKIKHGLVEAAAESVS